MSTQPVMSNLIGTGVALKSAIPPYTKSQAAIDARKNLLASFNGSLATIMRDAHGLAEYPLGSVVPFCLNKMGQPILLISDLAQHTKNIHANSKASLMIHDTSVNNIQTGWRLTLVGNVKPIDPQEYEATAELYSRFYPDSNEYHTVHDFAFYAFIVEKYRFINGFGMIHWVNKSEVITPSPFSAEATKGIINHMDNDHLDTIINLLKSRKQHSLHPHVGQTKIKSHQRMVSIDQYGIVLGEDDALHRFFFEQPATTTNEVRLEIIKLAKSLR